MADYAVGWVVGMSAGGYGSIIHTRDGGQTWVRRGDAVQIPDVDLYGVWAVDADTAWVVGQRTTVVYTDDGRIRWQTRQYPPNNMDTNGAATLDRNSEWVVADCGGIYRSDDRGLSWAPQESNQDGHHLLRIGALDGDNAWVVGVLASSGEDFGVLLRTDDGGVSWQRQTTLLETFWADVSQWSMAGRDCTCRWLRSARSDGRRR